MAKYYARPLTLNSEYTQLHNLSFTHDGSRLVIFRSRRYKWNEDLTEYCVDMFDQALGLQLQQMNGHGEDLTEDDSVPDPEFLFMNHCTDGPPTKSMMRPWDNKTGWFLMYLALDENYVQTFHTTGKHISQEVEPDYYEKSDIGKAVPNINEDVSLAGNVKVTILADGQAQAMNVKSGAVIQDLHDVSGPITSVSISPDEKHIATGTNNGSVLIWDLSENHGADVSLHMKRGITELHPEVHVGPDEKTIKAIEWEITKKELWFNNPQQAAGDLNYCRYWMWGTDNYMVAIFRYLSGETDYAKIVRLLLQYQYLGIALLAYDSSPEMEERIERSIAITVEIYNSRHPPHDERQDRDHGRPHRYDFEKAEKDLRDRLRELLRGHESELTIPLSIEDAYELPFKGESMAKVRALFRQYSIGANGFQMPPPDPETSPAAESAPVVEDLTFQKTHELSFLTGQAYLLKPLAKRLSDLAKVDVAKIKMEVRERLAQSHNAARFMWVAMCKRLNCPLDPLDPKSKVDLSILASDVADGPDGKKLVVKSETWQGKTVAYAWSAGAAEYIRKLNEQAKEDDKAEKEALKEYLAVVDEHKDEDLQLDHILGAVSDLKMEYGI